MKTTCPECKKDFNAPVGRPVPCPGCGNPVVAEARAERPSEARSRPEPASTPSPAPIPWGKAALVLLVLAVAHYGIYRLVSASARSEIAAIEARHGGRLVGSAAAPGDPPSANSADYAAWVDRNERHLDARAWREHESRRAWVARGLALAFVVQVVILGFALFRVAGAATRRTRQAGRARA